MNCIIIITDFSIIVKAYAPSSLSLYLHPLDCFNNVKRKAVLCDKMIGEHCSKPVFPKLS